MTAEAANALSTGDWLVLSLAAAALLGTVHAALSLCGCDGLPQLWRGSDGRTSTSKFQAVIWTLAVAWALLSLLLAEAILGGGRSALSAGWEAFLSAGDGGTASLQVDYLALLGIPIATAVAAKAITTTKVANGTVQKPAAQGKTGMRDQAMQLVGDDRGQPAILDFQLVVFNLLLLAFFTGTFLTEPARGLPDLPETLLLLAGVSSGSYTLDKALQRTAGPAITSVRPSRIVAGPEPVEIDIFGGPFGARDAADGAQGVMVAGVPLQIAQWTNEHVRAVMPPQSAEHPVIPAGISRLVISDGSGIESEGKEVEVALISAPADPPSDDRLSPEALIHLEEQLADLLAAEQEEDDRVAATVPARREPGSSHLEDEPVHADEEI